MMHQLLQQYRSGDVRSVTDLYERNPLGLRDNDEAALLVVAQSYYKLGQPAKAGPLFLRAGLATRPVKKQLFELAFALLQAADDIEGGLEASRQLLLLDPFHQPAAVYRRHFLPYLLAFDEIEAGNRAARTALEAGDPFALSCELPWDNIAWCSDERINARILNPVFPAHTQESRAARRRLPPPAGRIRVGYLSNDFSTQHATGA